MPDFAWPIVASAAGVDLSLGRFLHVLRCSRQLRPLLLNVLVGELLLAEARQAGLSIAAEELQQAGDRFRYRHGLNSGTTIQSWLAHHGLTLDDFEAGLERELLIEKFKDYLAAQHAADHFAANRDRYARAQLRQIVVASDGIARELLARITDEGYDFAELAREDSLDNAVRQTGGSIGVVPRYSLPAAIADAVFAAKPGAVVGPFATQHGVHLFLVEALHEPVLDAATATAIRSELFERWLAEQMKDVRIDLSSLGTSP